MASGLGMLEAREKKVREEVARLREEAEQVQAALMAAEGALVRLVGGRETVAEVLNEQADQGGELTRSSVVGSTVPHRGENAVASALAPEIGAKRLETWLRNRRVLRTDQLAKTALQAQHTSLPGEKLTAQLVHTLAKEVMVLNQQVAELDKAIEARFRDHHTFDVITSMPSLGVILCAEFLAATGGDMTVFATADRLAGFGGVAPVPRDSSKISGYLRRPQRYNRRLQRVFYISALFSIRRCEESRRVLRPQTR